MFPVENKTKFVQIINEEYDKVLIENFLEEVEYYQSNHYGAYNRNRLVRAYHSLPNYFKKAIFPSKYQHYWRGADGIVGDYGAISFTDRRSNAGFYGTFAFPFSELQSYSGLIDTSKLVRFLQKYKIDNQFDIGDDENEIIVIEPHWKPGLNDREEQYRY